MKIGFIGLGNMGGDMAANLARVGHVVKAFNLSKDALAQAKAKGCVPCASIQEAVVDADAVVTMLPNGKIVEQVYAEDVVGHAPRSATLIDCSTIDVETATKVARDAAKRGGYEMVDAPVSGGQGGAQNGLLTVMCGGDADIFEITKPAAMAFSRAYTLMGESGAGQLTKMVNQVCIAGLVQGLSEAIAFGQKAGLDMNLVLDVIGKGAAQSWQMDNRGKTMVADKFDFGFAVDWMRKDLGLVMEEAKRNGARLPVTALVDQFYADVQQMGGKRWDTSSLIKRLG